MATTGSTTPPATTTAGYCLFLGQHDALAARAATILWAAEQGYELLEISVNFVLGEELSAVHCAGLGRSLADGSANLTSKAIVYCSPLLGSISRQALLDQFRRSSARAGWRRTPTSSSGCEAVLRGGLICCG